MYWYPWDDEKEELWVRPMPKMPYIINLKTIRLSFINIKWRRKIYMPNLANGMPSIMKEAVSAWWGTIYPKFCFADAKKDGKGSVKISLWLAQALDW